MKQNLFGLVTLLLITALKAESFEKDEVGTLLLNETDLQTAIDRHETLIILAYLKDAPEANSVVKIFNNVGKILQSKALNVVLGKLSLGYDNTIFEKYSLEGAFGLVALMDHGERFVEYTQLINNEEKIIDFIRKKLANPVKEINDTTILRSLIEKLPCASIGFFQNFTSSEYEEYLSAADWFYECDHFATKNLNMFNYFDVNDTIPTIKFYKECIHEVTNYPKQLPFDSNNILKYFLVCMEPLVAEYGMNWLTKKVIVQPQFTLILFVKKDDPKKRTYIDIMTKYARRYREEINMVYMDFDGAEDIRSFSYTFDVNETDIPCLRAIETSNRYANNTRKYKPRRKSINDASVRQFIGDVYYRQLAPYLISDKLPNDWNSSALFIIVGDNFRNVTEDSEKTVVIAFYNDEYKYESFVNKELKDLATEFQKLGRSDIIIGKSNYDSNEYFGWHPDRFPKIILFPKGKNSLGVEFEMEMTLKDLKIFIESDGQLNQKTVEENKTNKSKESVQEPMTPDEEADVEEIDSEEVIINKQNYSTQHSEL